MSRKFKPQSAAELVSSLGRTMLLAAGLCGCCFFNSQGKTITYTEDMTDFPNPERGFWGGTVSKKYISLPTTGVLQQSFLDGVEKIFNDTRNAKKKVVPRFRYNGSDAPLDAMLKQIEQLKPIFQSHYDVIAVLEAGFVGDYGEWHSSENIKTADARRQVLLKLLDVLPKERMVTLRYNTHKRAIFASNEPITRSQAFDGSNKSRTGGQNDCFVTNESDAGTYHTTWDEFGLGYEAEKDFLSADNLYVPQEGETCQVGSVSYASCAKALADMARMRWDMIQTGWYGPVLSQWKSQGCWDEMSRRLGYRIVLIDGTFDDEVTDGSLNATLRLKNVGFGKIYNPRKLEMVLRNASNGNEYILPLPQDPRFWSPGLEQSLNIQIAIPPTIPFGTYSLFLCLRDPAPKLYSIPEYAVRLANKDVWDFSKGYNSLQHAVKISSYDITASKKMNSELSGKESGIRVYGGKPGKKSVEIVFSTPAPSPIRIDVYDLSGAHVANLVRGTRASGSHRIVWQGVDDAGREVHEGVYCVTYRFAGTLDAKKIVLRK